MEMLEPEILMQQQVRQAKCHDVTSNSDQARHQIQQVPAVPHLPRKAMVDVTKRQACQEKCRQVPQRQWRPTTTNRHQTQPVPEVPHLPHKVLWHHGQYRATNGYQACPQREPSA